VSERLRIPAAIVAVVLALTLVLAGQFAADVAAPSVPNGALTGQAMGRAGFAYLTGLRKFAAALLWNRLEPQMHEYYGATGLGNMVFMLPNVKAIVTLDPQFVEAYYVAPEILIQSGLKKGVPVAEAKRRLDTALALAKEGVTNNPKSGLMLTSYAELLWTRGKDLQAALPYARASMADGIIWRTDEEHWDQFAIVRDMLKVAGDTAGAAAAQGVMDAIDANPNSTKNAVDPNE